MESITFFIPVILIVGFLLASMVRVLSEWERGVVLRLGRSIGLRGPGLILLIPIIERLIKVDTRTVTMDVQPQDVITKDNVSMKVDAVLYFRVVEPESAITKVADYYFATLQLAQTTLRSVMGRFTLDEILENRDKINHALQEILDKTTEAWGIKVTLVELKNVDLPREMQRAMAAEAEGERERRAKIIAAEGELQRAQKLSEASQTLASSPSGLQLAYLQTLHEIAGDKSNTIIFPLPMDLIRPFLGSDKPSTIDVK